MLDNRQLDSTDIWSELAKKQPQGTLFVISGPSGVGKGTVVRQIVETSPNLVVSVSTTTRPPREGEQNGIDYDFVSKEKFLEMIDHQSFLEYALVFSGEYYGTPKAFIEKQIANGQDVILEIDVQGAALVKKNWDNPSVHIFILPPSQRELESRLKDRATETAKAIEERLIKARQEVSCLPDYDYYVFNHTVDKAVDDVSAIILAERLRVQNLLKKGEKNT